MTSLKDNILGAEPIFNYVEGAPYQPGQVVVVASSNDPSDGTVLQYVGQLGVVNYLEYCCGCGQTYPSDPMIGVMFSSGAKQEFWSEELRLVRRV